MKIQRFYLGCGMVFVLMAISGCRALYQGFQISAQQRCYQLEYQEQEQCLKENDVGYDEYSRQRKNESQEPKQAH